MSDDTFAFLIVATTFPATVALSFAGFHMQRAWEEGKPAWLSALLRARGTRHLRNPQPGEVARHG